MSLCRLCPTKSPQGILRASGNQLQVIDFKGLNWWAHKDLNLGPTDYESGALTN